MVPPAGKFNKKAIVIPNMTDNTEKIIDVKMVILKLKDNCRAVSGGIINMAETSIIPATFMAKTAATAVSRRENRINFSGLNAHGSGQFFIECDGQKIIVQDDHCRHDGQKNDDGKKDFR